MCGLLPSPMMIMKIRIEQTEKDARDRVLQVIHSLDSGTLHAIIDEVGPPPGMGKTAAKQSCKYVNRVAFCLAIQAPLKESGIPGQRQDAPNGFIKVCSHIASKLSPSRIVQYVLQQGGVLNLISVDGEEI
jgi:hypothetical protein